MAGIRFFARYTGPGERKLDDYTISKIAGRMRRDEREREGQTGRQIDRQTG